MENKKDNKNLVSDVSLDSKLDKLISLDIQDDAYGIAIDRLNKLDSALNKYDFCFKVSGIISYVKTTLNKDYISEFISTDRDNVDIKALVDKVVEGIKVISESEIESYVEIRKLVDHFCESIYLVIKEEILITNKSELFDFIQNYPVYVFGVSDRIMKEIKDKRLDNIYEIGVKCSNLDTLGLDSNYFDMALIRMIVEEENRDLFIEKRSNELRNLASSFSKNFDNIKEESGDIDFYRNMLSENKKEMKSLIHSIVKRGISFDLSLTTLVTLSLFKFPKLCTYDTYKTTTTTYTNDGIVGEPIEGYEE